MLGYDQVKRWESHPEALRLAMQMADTSPDETFHLGGQAEYTHASRSACVTALGVGWGLADTGLLETSKPDHFIMSVLELQEFFWKSCSCFWLRGAVEG